jgi:LPXTG-motif cell wall-anchored protein
MPKTTKESIKGTATVKTEVMRGVVSVVEGNNLEVRMSTGDTRIFNVPESRRFIVDGKELTVGELKPGTRLTATVTTTNTPVTERTTTVGTGKVWHVSGNNVILTLPNNENHMYKVQESYRFNVNGQKATVHDLRKGMIVSAEKIVEEPRTEIVSNTVVTGHAPPEPKRVMAETPRQLEQPAPARAPAPSHKAAPAAAPASAPAAAPAEAAPAASAERAEPATELPKTGSPVPLVGLLGLLLTGASMGLRRLRGV